MSYKFLKYENALFRQGGKERLEIFYERSGWKPYNEPDVFDVEMRGMPVDDAYAADWTGEGEGYADKAPAAAA